MAINNFIKNSNIQPIPPTPITPQSPPPTMQDHPLLINYNDKYKTTGTTLYREAVIQQTLSILIGKDKPNALLVGQAGVGKTKIVEDIAYRLASNDMLIPPMLKDHIIYELPLSNIVAGSGIVGEIEAKIQDVIEFASDPKNKIILFIDEIHQLSSDTQTYAKIAQILKPALSRGEIRVIGATTTQEAKQFLKDPALNRRFTRTLVDELSNEQTLDILKNVLPKFTTHYQNKIHVPHTLLPTIIHIANKYTTAGNHRPDNAITLLDRIMADGIINLQLKIQAAQNNPVAQTALATTAYRIREKDIQRVAISMLRGHSTNPDIDLDQLNQNIKKHIKNQDDVIDKVIHQLKRKQLALFDTNKPLSFLWAGQSGTGKTELAKQIAQSFTGLPPIILNMTEYHSSASINRLIGSPAGYVGSESNNELPFDCLETNPYRVILLDELEKADKGVQRLFMSALDEGYIKTNRNTTIDFSKTIIIATTNAGQTHQTPKLGFVNATSTITLQETITNLAKHFDIEFINRFQQNITTFNPISEDTYRTILQTIYQHERERIINEKPKLKNQLPDQLSTTDCDRLVKDTYIPQFNARPAKNAVMNHIESIFI